MKPYFHRKTQGPGLKPYEQIVDLRFNKHLKDLLNTFLSAFKQPLQGLYNAIKNLAFSTPGRAQKTYDKKGFQTIVSQRENLPVEGHGFKSIFL